MAMNQQRKTSNVLNILNYDDAGNIVIKDYGQVTRYSWNGLIHGFVGPVSVSSVSAATTDTDRFLVSDGGVLKYRTGVELLSDIGGVPSTRTLTINGVTQDLSADRSWTVSGGGTTIYTGDGTLASDRTVTNSTFLLQFKGGQVSLGNEETALRLETSTTGKELLFSLNNLSGKNWLIRSLSSGNLDFRNITNARTSFLLDGASADVTFVGNIKNSSNWFFLGGGPFHKSLILGKASVTSTNYSVAENGAETMINADTGGLLRFRIANADKMMLTNAGRLLLGTTTEGTYLLDVNGTARVRVASGTNLYIESGGTNITRLLFADDSKSTAHSALLNAISYDIRVANNTTLNIGSSLSQFSLVPLEVSISGGDNQFRIRNSAFIAEQVATLGFFHSSETSPRTQIKGNIGRGFGTTRGGSIEFFTTPFGGSISQFMRLSDLGQLLVGSSINLDSHDTSALVQINSTNRGFLPPRMTTTQKNAIGTPAAGLVVYDNTDNYLSLYNGTNWQNTVSPNSAGNVLIGIAIDLGYKLQVSGTIYAINGGVYSDLNSTINQALYATNQSLTGAASNGMVYLETTWNTTGNPSAIYLNVTNTASGSFSKLLDLRVGLTPVFQVDKTGGVFTGQPIGGSNGVWKFGQYNATAPSATGYVEVEVNGTLYKLLAST